MPFFRKCHATNDATTTTASPYITAAGTINVKVRNIKIWPDVLDTSQTNGCEITVVNTSLNAGTTRDGKDQQTQSEFLQPTHLFFV
jgi:hypothetical protein